MNHWLKEILILPQNRPAFFENYDRSHAWVLYRQLIRTKAQFDEVLKQAAKCLAGSIKGDDESAKEVERLFVEEANKILQKIISLLEQLLRQPPPKGGAKSQYFEEDDCSNTSSDSDKPPTLSKQIPSTQTFCLESGEPSQHETIFDYILLVTQGIFWGHWTDKPILWDLEGTGKFHVLRKWEKSRDCTIDTMISKVALASMNFFFFSFDEYLIT